MDAGAEGLLQPADARFDADWRLLGAPRRLLLAVSGGADSMALMQLAARLPAGGADVHVATVDHALRAGSSADAQFVLGAAARLGLTAACLRWEGPKPSSGLQAAARGARYRLLAREAERWRADAIMTAHTADDQAETVLMRIMHRTEVAGLSGMAPEIFIADGAGPTHRLLRPLLGWRRAALRAHLSMLSAPFVDDPSNDDARFERVRVRRLLAQSPQRADIVGALAGLAERAGALRRLADRIQRAQVASSAGEFLVDGAIRLRARDLERVADGALAARLIGAVGSGEFVRDEAAFGALGAALAGRRATLGGALIAREGPHVVFMREPSAVLGRHEGAARAPIRIEAGARVLWDQRFMIENTLGAPAEIRPLGAAAPALTSATDAESLATAPGLWVSAALAAFPGDHDAGDSAIISLAAERFDRRVVRH